MKQVRAHIPRPPCYVYRYIKRGYDHQHTEGFEEKAPAGILDQPKGDVQVLVFADIFYQFIWI